MCQFFELRLNVKFKYNMQTGHSSLNLGLRTGFKETAPSPIEDSSAKMKPGKKGVHSAWIKEV